jgi:predicted metal-dependent HD superfamily phosphohydrolase
VIRTCECCGDTHEDVGEFDGMMLCFLCQPCVECGETGGDCDPYGVGGGGICYRGSPRTTVDRILAAAGVDRIIATLVSESVVRRMGRNNLPYHNIWHIIDVLNEALRLLPFEPEANQIAVLLAAAYHDVVYDIDLRHGANEEASAVVAVAELSALNSGLVAEVGRLIRLTDDHNIDPADRSGAVLVDADLGILAADPTVYADYTVRVRGDYRKFSDEQWKAGRPVVLRKFLDNLGSYFLAGPTEDRLFRRASARRNIDFELVNFD